MAAWLFSAKKAAAALGRQILSQHGWLRLLLFGGGLYFTAWQLATNWQTYPDGPPATTWLGLLLSLLVYFDLQTRSPHLAAPTVRAGAGRVHARPWRSSPGLLRLGVGLALAALSTLLLLWRIPQLTYDGDYRLVAVAWVTAFLAYLYAVAPLAQFRPAPWPRFMATGWRQWLIMATLLFLALSTRYWRVASIPYILAGDEASQGLEAMRVLSGDIGNPFATGWLGVPTMSFFFNAISLGSLGQSAWALRLPWALVGAVTVLVTYALTVRLQGRRFALVTATLLAVYHYHIHFSRLGSNQVADPLFGALALFFLQRGLDRGRQLDWALLGGVTGLAFYFYAGARFTPVLVIAILGYRLLYDRGRFVRRHWRGVLIALGAFLVIGAPMLQYAIRFPGDFNARINTVGIIQSGWLTREVGIRGQPTLAILWDQFQRAFLAFNYFPDRTVWYGLRQPLLDPAYGILFLFGLGVATIRALGTNAQRSLLPMVAWWWGGIILGGMLTESPPSSMRLITLAVPTCFLLTYAFFALVRLLHTFFGDLLPAPALLLGLTLGFSLISLHTYFVQYTPARIYGGQHAEVAVEVAPILRDFGPAYQPFFVGAPQMYWGFATLPFLAHDSDGVDIIDEISAPLPPALIPTGRGAIFIFLPFRLAELAYVQQTFPGGSLQSVYSPVRGEIARLYVVPPGRDGSSG